MGNYGSFFAKMIPSRCEIFVYVFSGEFHSSLVILAAHIVMLLHGRRWKEWGAIFSAGGVMCEKKISEK